MAAAASACALRPPVIALPSARNPIDTANGNKVFVLLDKVKHAKELSDVEEHWSNTSGDGTIVAVHRVQNEAQYRRFRKKATELCKSDEQAQLNIIVYHGTGANKPSLICESDSGFDPSKGEAVPGSVSATLFAHAAAAKTQSSFCCPLSVEQLAVVRDERSLLVTGLFASRQLTHRASGTHLNIGRMMTHIRSLRDFCRCRTLSIHSSLNRRRRANRAASSPDVVRCCDAACTSIIATPLRSCLILKVARCR